MEKVQERYQYLQVDSSKVRPLEGSYIEKRMRKNAAWLLSLSIERLTENLLRNCGLSDGHVQPYGGWQNYHPHYLRAMCGLYRSFKEDGTGDLPEALRDDRIAEEAKKRAIRIVQIMIRCQQETAKTYPEGMISPRTENMIIGMTKFTRDSIYSHCGPGVYYGIHKEMYGLLMAYRTFGLTEALEAAEKIAKRIHEVMSPIPQDVRELMTDSGRANDFFSEVGGIMDVLIMLYEDTGNPLYLETSTFFRKSWFDKIYLEGRDQLATRMEHANAEIPYLEGMAHLYAVTGEENALTVAKNFLYSSIRDHELPHGGVSGRSSFPDYQSELYNYPKRVFFHIMDTDTRKGVDTGESCCSHNLNRVTRRILMQELDPMLMDGWERRYVNAVISQQNKDTGQLIYDCELKINAHKIFGYPDKSFWCCYGTGAEEYSALTEGAFYENEDTAAAVLYMPCVYRHTGTGIRITETTEFPDDGIVFFKFEDAGKLKLTLRIPAWLQEEAKITLTAADGTETALTADGTYECGMTVTGSAAPGSLFTVEREWNAGDTLRLEMPFALRYVCMPDRPEYISVYYGPNLEVLCAADDQIYDGTPEQLLANLEPAYLDTPCTYVMNFSTDLTRGTYTLKPLRMVKDETYSGYLHVRKPPKDVILDEILIGEKESLEAHDLHGVGLKFETAGEHVKMYTSLTYFSDPGIIEFNMKSDPESEIQLRLWLDGSVNMYIHEYSGHVINPLFDLQIEHDGVWETFSTKSMEADYPGKIYYENFYIPRKWTDGKETLHLRLAARNFHDYPAVIEKIVDKMELFTLPVTEGTIPKA